MNKSTVRIISILFGIVLFLLTWRSNPFGLDERATKALAIGILMVTWWVTQALPMPVVALLPLLLFPILGVAEMGEVAGPYASPIIFLFMGGFMIALAIEKWGLHKRAALSIIKVTGTSGNRIVLGFILASGMLSMWLSNTATTMMMYPIALSVIKVMEDNGGKNGNLNNLGVCLLLAIAYSSNFGGIATIIGTPPNVAYVGYLEKSNGYIFQFVDWMKLCLPISLILLFTLYFVMTKILYPNRIAADGAAKVMIHSELKKLGKMSTPEKRVLSIFALTALLWITKSIINDVQHVVKLNDAMIALTGGILMFVFPSGSKEHKALLQWEDTKNLAWGILILFGGGITLAAQLEKAGIIQSLGEWIAGFASGGMLLIFIVAIVSIFISEVMSNVAQVIVFAPVITSMAITLRIDPLQVGVAMTLGASCAGMLPMGTPPNAIVFASGKLKLKHMTTTGFIMNLVSAVLITAFCHYLLPMLIERIS